MPVPRLAALRRRLAAALGVALALALAGATVAATGPASSSEPATAVRLASPRELATQIEAARTERYGQTLMVLGDSISARFNDQQGDELQGFWSMLAHDVGATPELRAEGGAGFVNPGLGRCSGNSLTDQLASPEVAQVVAAAGVVLVEGGRTDTQTCRPGGGYELIPDAQLTRAVGDFMARVRQLRGGPDACTIVVVPWGPAGLMANRDRVTHLVKRASERNGFTFVDTIGLLTEANTIEDRVHPSRVGNRALTRAILDQSPAGACFFRERLAALDLGR